MTDYRELLEAIYGNLSKLHGLIKDNEQNLRVIDKADSLMEDAKTDLLYLNDCIDRYVNGVWYRSQYADCLSSDMTRPSNTSASPPGSDVGHNQQQNTKQPPLTGDLDDEIL